MRVIPVLDVMNGIVVRGMGGRRDEYRPIQSRLVESAEPLEVARAIRDCFQTCEMYLADLDAIRGGEPAGDLYARIAALGIDLWVDAGCDSLAGARRVADAGVRVVAGLETLPSAEILEEIVQGLAAERVVYSLDLRSGVPLRDWGLPTAWDIARRAIQCGIRRAIVLDLARVGMGDGIGTESLCRQVAASALHDGRLTPQDFRHS